MKKSAYQARTKPLSFPFGGEELSVTYRPAFFTPADTQEKVKQEKAKQEKRKNGEEDENALVSTLLRLLATGPLTDEDDRPYPVTREELSGWGYDLLNAVFSAILEDINPPRKAG